MKNIKDKTSILSSPKNETEIVLSQKLQREETLLRNLLDSTCRFHEFNKSSSSSSVNNRTNTLIQHNIELEERKSIVILRQELVDCKVLQEQQMQVMGHLDAENKVLQTRIDNLLEWKRKISGQASLVLKTINRMFQASSASDESPEMKGGEFLGLTEIEWNTPLIPVDVRDKSFLLRIATVLEQYEQVIDPEMSAGGGGTTPGDLFSAAAFTEAFFCHNCMVKYSDDSMGAGSQSHASYDINKLVDAFNETSFLVTQSSAEEILFRLFDIFATRQRDEMLSEPIKATAKQTSPSIFAECGSVPYIGEEWFMMLCISCELIDKKVSFEVVEAIYLQLSGDNGTRKEKGFVGLDYNSFFIAMYIMACMKYDQPDDQQKMFLLIESVQPTLKQILEKPQFLDKIVTSFSNFVSQKIYYKYIQYQKILYSSFKSCIKKYNSSRMNDSASISQQPSPRRRSASFSALGRGSGSSSNSNSARSIGGYNSTASSQQLEVGSAFEIFCQKYRITPDLVSLPLVRRVASQVQALFTKTDSYISFFGCLHFLVVSLIDNAVLQTPSKQAVVENGNRAKKLTISNLSSLVQVGIERIAWQVQSLTPPNSNDLIRSKPFSPKMDKRSPFARSSEAISTVSDCQFNSSHSVTAERISHPILSMTDIDIIGHTSGGQLLLAENESLRREVSKLKSENARSIQDLEKTIAWQNEQLELSRQEFDLQRSFLSQQSDSSAAIISALRRQLDHSKVDASTASEESFAAVAREYERQIDELNSVVATYKNSRSEETKNMTERVHSLEGELRGAVLALDNEKVLHKEIVEALTREYEMKSVELGVRNIDYLTKIDALTAQVYECQERLYMREEEIASIMRTQQLLNTMDSLQGGSSIDGEDSYNSRLSRASMLISALQLQLEAATATISTYCSETDHISYQSELYQQEIELKSMAFEDVYNLLVRSHVTTQHLELKIDAIKSEMTTKVLNLSAVHSERLVSLTQWKERAMTLEREKSATELDYVNEFSNAEQKHAIEIAVHEEQARILQRDIDKMESVIAEQSNQLQYLSSQVSALQESERQSECKILKMQNIIQRNESKESASVKANAEVITQLESDLSDLQVTLQNRTAAYEEKVVELERKLEAQATTVIEHNQTFPVAESAIGGKKLVTKDIEYHDTQAQHVISSDKFVATETTYEQTVSGSANFDISFESSDVFSKENAMLKEKLSEEKASSVYLNEQLKKLQEELTSTQGELKKKILKERNAALVRDKAAASAQQELNERNARIQLLEDELAQLRSSLSLVPSEEAMRKVLEVEELNQSLRYQLSDSKRSVDQKLDSMRAEMDESKSKHANEIRELRSKLSAAVEKIQSLQLSAVSETVIGKYSSMSKSVSDSEIIPQPVAITQQSADIAVSLNPSQSSQPPLPPARRKSLNDDAPPPPPVLQPHSGLLPQPLTNLNPPQLPLPPARRQSVNDAPPPPPGQQSQEIDASQIVTLQPPQQPPHPPIRRQSLNDAPPPPPGQQSQEIDASQIVILEPPPQPPHPPIRRQSVNDAPPPPPGQQSQEIDASQNVILEPPPQPPHPPIRRQSLNDAPPPPPRPQSQSTDPSQNPPMRPPLPPPRRQSLNDASPPPPPPQPPSQPAGPPQPPLPPSRRQSASIAPPPPPVKNSLQSLQDQTLPLNDYSLHQLRSVKVLSFVETTEQTQPSSSTTTREDLPKSQSSQSKTAFGHLLFQDWHRIGATVPRSVPLRLVPPPLPPSRSHSIREVPRPPLTASSITPASHPPPPLNKRDSSVGLIPPVPPPPQPPSRRNSATAASVPPSDSGVVSVDSLQLFRKEFVMDYLPPSEVPEAPSSSSSSQRKHPSRSASIGSIPPPPPGPASSSSQIPYSHLPLTRRASYSNIVVPLTAVTPHVLPVFNRKSIFIDLPDNMTELTYPQWVEEVRTKFKNWRDHEDFFGQTDYEFSQKLRRHLKFTECDAIVRYILSHSTSALLTALGDNTVNAYLAMLIEHFDLSRTGRISAKEFIDFLFPPPGVRELGLLVKFVREGITHELSKSRSKLSARSGSFSDFELFDAMIRLAKRKNVFASPYIGKNLETKTFRAILESLQILDRSEEVDLVIQAIDLNVDRRLSITEIKNWLFPAPAEDFIGKFRISGTLENDSESTYSHTAAAPLESMGQGDVLDGNSVLSMFRSALLAHCENDRNNVAETFLKFDSNKDGGLSINEVEEMIVYLLTTLRERFVDEDLEESIALSEQGGSDIVVGDRAKEEDLRQALMERHRREAEEEAAGINALLFEHIDGDKNGTIELEELRSFDLTEKAVRQKILHKMGLTDASTSIISAVDSALCVMFRTFLESSPANKNFKCSVSDGVFVSLALERALICLPMPEFGGSQHLTGREVALILSKMDEDHDGVVTVEELRSWLLG
eukprot:gene24872-33362_t